MPIAYDSMVGAHLLNEELPIGLKPLASMELGVDNWGKGSQKFGVEPFEADNFKLTPLYGPDGMGVYCARDTAYSHLLAERQKVQFRAMPDLRKLLVRHVLPGLNSILAMEINGIWVDRTRLEPRIDHFRLRKIELRDELLVFVPEDFRATANFDNDHFLRRWLFGEPPSGLGLEPVSQTPTGLNKVDEEVLKLLVHPAMDVLREYNKTTKAIEFLTSWIKFAGPDWRLHPHYNPTGTVTGRRSCDNPNLMQTPRDPSIRSILGAPAGWVWFAADYSMIEVRIAAWLANETVMLGLFKRGEDVYRYTAALINGYTMEQFRALPAAVAKKLRQGAKAVVLGFLYGMGAKNFVRYAKKTFGVDFTEEEAERFRELFFETYPGLVGWHEAQHQHAKKHGWVDSPLHRVRHLTAIYSQDGQTRHKAIRQAINSPVQGTGGDCTEAAMNSLYKALMAAPEEVMLVGDIHDALLFQIRADVWERWTHTILKAMEELPSLQPFGWHPPFRLKAEGEIGHYWGEGIEISLDDYPEPGILNWAAIRTREADKPDHLALAESLAT